MWKQQKKIEKKFDRITEFSLKKNLPAYWKRHFFFGFLHIYIFSLLYREISRNATLIIWIIFLSCNSNLAQLRSFVLGTSNFVVVFEIFNEAKQLKVLLKSSILFDKRIIKIEKVFVFYVFERSNRSFFPLMYCIITLAYI